MAIPICKLVNVFLSLRFLICRHLCEVVEVLDHWGLWAGSGELEQKNTFLRSNPWEIDSHIMNVQTKCWTAPASPQWGRKLKVFKPLLKVVGS